MNADSSTNAQLTDAELDTLLRRIDASVEDRIRHAADLDAGLADVESEAAWRRHRTPASTEDISGLIATLSLIDDAPGR